MHAWPRVPHARTTCACTPDERAKTHMVARRAAMRSGVPWGTFFSYILILKVLRGTIFRISIQPILKFLLILLIENILCTGTHRPAASNRVAWRLTAASADDGTQMPYSGHLWPGLVEVPSSADAAAVIS